ncbi:hypothetical protein TB2_033923 [Malus domestica]
MLGKGQHEVNVSNKQKRQEFKPLGVFMSKKQLKKCAQRDDLAAHAIEQAKKEALKDDRDAFTVVIGSRASVLDGEDSDANVKDITIENFSLSARGKELLRTHQ